MPSLYALFCGTFNGVYKVFRDGGTFKALPPVEGYL